MKFQLRERVSDSVTEFTGIITSRCEHISGEPIYRVEGMDDTGRPISDWFDESRLERAGE